MRIVTLAERPDLAERLEAPELTHDPEFLFHDPAAVGRWERLAADFPEYQIAMVEGDRILAKGHSIPLRWTGADADLPQEGWDFAIERGCADLDAGVAPTVASALSIVVAEDRLGTGLSRVMVEGLRDAAAARGLTALLAPVRPNHKPRYPLVPMAEYAAWTLPGGAAPFDPWLRVHWRAGGRILHVCERSMTIPAPIAAWERWTGLAMPDSGDYVIDGALAPVAVDRERDEAVYVEPNVWVCHDIAR